MTWALWFKKDTAGRCKDTPVRTIFNNLLSQHEQKKPLFYRQNAQTKRSYAYSLQWLAWTGIVSGGLIPLSAVSAPSMSNLCEARVLENGNSHLTFGYGFNDTQQELSASRAYDLACTSSESLPHSCYGYVDPSLTICPSTTQPDAPLTYSSCKIMAPLTLSRFPVFISTVSSGDHNCLFEYTDAKTAITVSVDTNPTADEGQPQAANALP